MKIFISQEQVQCRVAEMAREIDEHYRGREFTVVAILNGAMFFAVDLCRALKGNFQLDSIGASSYVDTRSCGKITVRGSTKYPVAGKEILLVDGVLDTGLTLAMLKQEMLEQSAAEVRIAVLAEKAHPRNPLAAELQAEWVGFKLPDKFLVGCGMDANERYRELPYIGMLEEGE